MEHDNNHRPQWEQTTVLQGKASYDTESFLIKSGCVIAVDSSGQVVIIIAPSQPAEYRKNWKNFIS